MPVIGVKLMADELAVSLEAASQGMRRLQETGVVRDHSGRGRGRSYAAEEVIGILARPFGVDPEIALQGARAALTISPPNR